MKGASFGVIAYAICYIIAVLIYCSPRVLAEFSSFDVSHINENFEFPLEIFSWGLLAVCSSYSGIDFGMNKLKANIICLCLSVLICFLNIIVTAIYYIIYYELL